MYYSHLSEVCLNFDQALDDADGLGVGQPGTMGQTMLGSLREEIQKLVGRCQGKEVVVVGVCKWTRGGDGSGQGPPPSYS